MPFGIPPLVSATLSTTHTAASCNACYHYLSKCVISLGQKSTSMCDCVCMSVQCGNCARHCPVGAIVMIEMDEDGFDSKKIPTINTERCIGCGACENLCPARPFSAIYVEGHTMHRTI